MSSDLFDNDSNSNPPASNALQSHEDIKKVAIYDEMKKSYLDYAMSVIVSRALPDIRDGLKPVHRRIIYSMFESGFTHNKPYRKSARIVGDVMGKYHPHGDSAIYDALVRMAQDFSLRLPLIDGQGNFGSMDGDNAAAMRYTEARMAHSAHALIDDIDKDTVDFRPNYDDSLVEPAVIPARYPNLLVNGASGIAVGMATNIPTHNLGELIDACLLLVENPEATVRDLMQFVKGPDFPTGAKILGYKGIESAFHTGRGSIIVCGVAEIEEGKSRSTIIIKEIPWQVNKAKLVEEISKIKDKSDSKELDVISSVRDESDRYGVRIVVELKKDAEPEIVLNYLQKYTAFQTSFGVNMLAIDNGIPKLLNLKDVLAAFVEFRKVVVRRRTLYLLQKARDRAHLLAGLGISVENIDEIIELIKNSPNPAAAREQLMAKPWRAGSITPYIELLDEPDRKVIDGMYYLSETQARGILDLRLHRLTGLEREKIQSDLDELAAEIKGYLEILGSIARLMEIIKEELTAVRSFATPRKTQIEEVYDEFSEEDFIQKEEVALTLTNAGYIKRLPITAYKTQKRGGKGKIGTNTKEEDVVTNILITNSHADILFFTDKGLVYKLKCYRIPESSTQALGRAIVNLLPIEKNEKITTILPIENAFDEAQDIVFITKSGGIRRSKLKDFANVNSKGKIAMKLDDGDSLVGVHLCNDDQDILISSHFGQCLRFPLETLRVIGSRNSTGVRAISLEKDDFVINVSILQHEKIESIEIREEYLKYANAKRKEEKIDVSLNKETIEDLENREEFILTVTSNGYGKRTSAYDYRITNRGGKGFLGGKLSDKNGYIVASFVVENDDEIIIISNKGQVIRQNVKDIRITSRVATGVILFRLEDDEVVQSVSKVKLLEDMEEKIEKKDSHSQEDLI
ncbi:MAG: DNA gyrase subunit A [Alphaproteobacteria bacterium]|nr:DNA gyrase subunit A [Alphaproteobacteria bacterium]